MGNRYSGGHILCGPEHQPLCVVRDNLLEVGRGLLAPHLLCSPVAVGDETGCPE